MYAHHTCCKYNVLNRASPFYSTLMDYTEENIKQLQEARTEVVETPGTNIIAHPHIIRWCSQSPI